MTDLQQFGIYKAARSFIEYDAKFHKITTHSMNSDKGAYVCQIAKGINVVGYLICPYPNLEDGYETPYIKFVTSNNNQLEQVNIPDTIEELRKLISERIHSI